MWILISGYDILGLILIGTTVFLLGSIVWLFVFLKYTLNINFTQLLDAFLKLFRSRTLVFTYILAMNTTVLILNSVGIILLKRIGKPIGSDMEVRRTLIMRLFIGNHIMIIKR